MKVRRPYIEARLMVLAIVILACALFITGQVATSVKKASSQDEVFLRFADLFSEVYREVQKRYVEEVDPEQILEDALRGMLSGLDRHSQYLDADELQEIEKETEGEFSGIGIHISLDENRVLTVVAPILGTPAAKAGILPWDRIIEIEGKSTENITLMEAVKKLTGPPGTKVTFKVYRKGEEDPLTFTLTREVVTVKSVHSSKIGNGIGYVRLSRFSENTAEDVKAQLLELKNKGIDALILDLRFNSGGLLKEAVDVGELFIPKGKLIVSTRGREASQNQKYYAEEDPIISVPMAVLVNRATASASEIVAGALKDQHLAVIIAPKGEKHTFGKGSVQTIEQLTHYLQVDEHNNPRPCAIRLTTAKYYTPSDVVIEGEGIHADVEVELPKDHEAKLLKQGLLGEPSLLEPEKQDEEKNEFYVKEEKKKEELQDLQLLYAEDLLRSFLILSTQKVTTDTGVEE